MYSAISFFFILTGQLICAEMCILQSHFFLSRLDRTRLISAKGSRSLETSTSSSGCRVTWQVLRSLVSRASLNRSPFFFSELVSLPLTSEVVSDSRLYAITTFRSRISKTCSTRWQSYWRTFRWLPPSCCGCFWLNTFEFKYIVPFYELGVSYHYCRIHLIFVFKMFACLLAEQYLSSSKKVWFVQNSNEESKVVTKASAMKGTYILSVHSASRTA